MEAIRNSLFELSGELMTSLSRILGLNVTVVIGRLTEQAGDVPAVLEQARQAARFRDMQMSLQVIDMEDVIPVARSTAQYPFAAEKELLQMMRLGLEQEAYAQLDCFVDEVEGSADWEMTVRQSLFQLVYGIRYMFIESGFHHHPLLAGGDLLEDMLSVQETAALKKWVRSHIIVPYMQQFQELQNGRTRRQVEQVIRLMNDRYGEDLSLDECAKETAANPFALSRSFKQVTGLNFVDYLTRVRIDKAKELLLTTGMKVNEIAERVGYQHSYFNKIFKGSESITPTQFRDKYKK
jgi:AraC-like DNA-binding protein